MKIHSVHPTQFRFSTRSITLSSIVQIHWDDNRLFIEHKYDIEERNPSPADWEAFWKEVDSIGVWKWKKSYRPVGIGVLDGWSWNLELAIGSKQVASSGGNGYPGTNGAEPSKQFLRLARALEKLARIELKIANPKYLEP